MKKIAIIGASGATGFELLKLALKEHIDPQQLLLIASEKSIGKTLYCDGHTFELQPISSIHDNHLEVIFLAAGSSVSKFVKAHYKDISALVIDLASTFRQEIDTPLIIPEINGDDVDLKKHRWICSPNCVTTLTLLVLAPLFKINAPKKVLLSTYQAASGAGYKAMEELKNETNAFLKDEKYHHIAFNDPYAFNLFTHNSPFVTDDDTDEEMKIRLESKKILKNEDLKISSTCVRVPTLRAHAISAYVEFSEPMTKDVIYETLANAPGIKQFEDFGRNLFATPQMAACKDEVYYGRIRKDSLDDQGFWFWIVGDQLLKGASLNAWQIYKHLRRHETFHSYAGSTGS
jgi:aspartate-semialdehyde dehydrogenase